MPAQAPWPCLASPRCRWCPVVKVPQTKTSDRTTREVTITTRTTSVNSSMVTRTPCPDHKTRPTTQSTSSTKIYKKHRLDQSRRWLRIAKRTRDSKLSSKRASMVESKIFARSALLSMQRRELRRATKLKKLLQPRLQMTCYLGWRSPHSLCLHLISQLSRMMLRRISMTKIRCLPYTRKLRLCVRVWLKKSTKSTKACIWIISTSVFMKAT